MGMMGRSPCKIWNEEILKIMRRLIVSKTAKTKRSEGEIVTECKRKPTALLILLLEKSDVCPASCPGTK
jgi:hypothetical protein